MKCLVFEVENSVQTTLKTLSSLGEDAPRVVDFNLL